MATLCKYQNRSHSERSCRWRGVEWRPEKSSQWQQKLRHIAHSTYTTDLKQKLKLKLKLIHQFRMHVCHRRQDMTWMKLEYTIYMGHIPLKRLANNLAQSGLHFSCVSLFNCSYPVFSNTISVTFHLCAKISRQIGILLSKCVAQNQVALNKLIRRLFGNGLLTISALKDKNKHVKSAIRRKTVYKCIWFQMKTTWMRSSENESMFCNAILLEYAEINTCSDDWQR